MYVIRAVYVVNFLYSCAIQHGNFSYEKLRTRRGMKNYMGDGE